MKATEFSGLQRRPDTQEIDVKVTLQAFAKELIAQRDAERKIRNNRRYRNAIRAVFARFAEGTRINMPALVALTMQHLDTKAQEYREVNEELQDHIRFNRTGYLRIYKGKAGGIGLAPKAPL